MPTDGAAKKHAPQREADALHHSYLVHGNALYLKIAAAGCSLAWLVYLFYDPPRGHSGSTWLGYTLGVVSAGLTGWLAWFGVRKRQFREGRGNARTWLSAHVYLGLALWFLATLHSAFQFGWNLHTLTYTLLCLVAGSGIYGAVAYSIFPARITANRQQLSPAAMLEEIAKLDEAALRMTEPLGPEIHEVVARSVGRVRVGGKLWEQLSGRYPKPGSLTTLREIMARKQAQPVSTIQRRPPPSRQDAGDQTIAFMTDQLFNTDVTDATRGQQAPQVSRVLETLSQRNALVDRLNRDITLRARQNAWLFLHVPLTVGLLAALVAHVLSVFLYW